MAGNIFEWLSHIRDLTLASSAASLLADVPGQAGGLKAVFSSHLSALPRVYHPSVSLTASFHSETVVAGVSQRGTMQVDVWVPDEGPTTGKTGLWKIYVPIKAMLHNGHERPGHPLNVNNWQVKWCFEGRVEDDLYEQKQHLYHLAALYEVVLREWGAEHVYGK